MSVGDSEGFFAYSELTVAVSWQSLTTRSDSMAKAWYILVFLFSLVVWAKLEYYVRYLAGFTSRRDYNKTKVNLGSNISWAHRSMEVSTPQLVEDDTLYRIQAHPTQ